MSSRAVVKYQVTAAVRACEGKKAEDITILQLDKNAGAFTDYFVICSGTNPRQIQAIGDDVRERLRIAGLHPVSTEGYNQAEWILLDYVDFVVHIFSEKARKFYDLERLWKSAKRLSSGELLLPEKKKPARAKTARRPAGRSKVRARRSSATASKKRISRKKK